MMEAKNTLGHGSEKGFMKRVRGQTEKFKTAGKVAAGIVGVGVLALSGRRVAASIAKKGGLKAIAAKVKAMTPASKKAMAAKKEAIAKRVKANIAKSEAARYASQIPGGKVGAFARKKKMGYRARKAISRTLTKKQVKNLSTIERLTKRNSEFIKGFLK